MSKMTSVYIGFLNERGNEPHPNSGYKRVLIGNADQEELLNFVLEKKIAFPKAEKPGYGDIAAIAAYSEENGGYAMGKWFLPEPVNIHDGVIPLIINGNLYRGLEVEAKITMQSADMCEF